MFGDLFKGIISPVMVPPLTSPPAAPEPLRSLSALFDQVRLKLRRRALVAGAAGAAAALAVPRFAIAQEKVTLRMASFMPPAGFLNQAIVIPFLDRVVADRRADPDQHLMDAAAFVAFELGVDPADAGKAFEAIVASAQAYDAKARIEPTTSRGCRMRSCAGSSPCFANEPGRKFSTYTSAVARSSCSRARVICPAWVCPASASSRRTSPR